MSSSTLQKEWATSYLSGGSMAYVDSLYEDYLADPNSVSSDWQKVFNDLPPVNGAVEEHSHRAIIDYLVHHAGKRLSSVEPTGDMGQRYRIADLVREYRSLGHLAAKLDPLEMREQPYVQGLDLESHQLADVDTKQPVISRTYFSSSEMPFGELYQALRDTYCGSIGIEFMHVANNEEIEWIEKRMESPRGRPNFDANKKVQILKALIAADGLERYLGTRYVGQKRFSLEGGDSLIAMMREIVDYSGRDGVKELVVGMAHRGRLNVLVNVLGKSPGQLFQEFEGKVNYDRTGDVKYHLGYSSDIKTESGAIVHVALAFNPSHLEIISPVVEGSARSRLERRHDLENKTTVVPIVVHGDAAFSGQGVVMETFNFSQARGYCTGGTIHIVINNQVGFTTSNPLDARSSLYCTDIAKMVNAPVVHVNGDDPEAVVFATQLAFDFRMKFKRDVVIELFCYRRNGHNEADEPAVTQPAMYKKIRKMSPLRELYGHQLISSGLLSAAEVDKLVAQYRDGLDEGNAVVQVVHEAYEGKSNIDWSPYISSQWTDTAKTSTTKNNLLSLAKQLNELPEGFQLHPVVERLLLERDKMTAGEIPMNWGYAEIMAYASLLQEGYGVRLSGQDSGRGTFAHRHAVLHDLNNGDAYIPLQKVADGAGSSIAVIDSVLSEEAVLAFEYGYASSQPSSLVLWEAQFGDFANGAQVVIDQFISSGEQKWGRLCGLVMLLPHGYEGQGPEHSSARLERFMQLCAQQNIQVCTPTTPAQMFHLLRRQVIRNFRKPLIVMTPKSLLRHKSAVSSLDDLTKGMFHTVLPEIDKLNERKVSKIILCCGKVYYDLLQLRRDQALEHVAIVRIEQLYPFPKKALIEQMERYPLVKEVVWCQEEPKNQGVWFSSQNNIESCLKEGQNLIYVGRESAAAPAAGSAALHAQQQHALVEEALLGSVDKSTVLAEKS